MNLCSKSRWLPLVLLVSSCASTADLSDQPLLFFPSPPAEPRVQFLTWASGSGQVRGEVGALEAFTLGAEASSEETINKPYGIAVRDGVVYVCDTKFPSVARLDFREGTYGVIGTLGPGALKKPINIAIDPLGYKFVVDTFRHQIVVFGPDDTYVASLDLPEDCRAVDLALHGNEIFVLDNDDSCGIVVLDRSTGAVQRRLGGPGGGPGEFHIPNSLCIDPEGFLYVSDTLNYRIQKLTPEGEMVWERGNAGYRLGQFGRPRGIRCGPDGVVYVVEGAMQLVQMYSSDGDVLMRFGGPGNIPGSMVLPATIAIDATSIDDFEAYIHEDFEVEYLMFVTSQYGARLVNVYALGAFPEGYRLGETGIATLPAIEEGGIGAVEPDAAIPTLDEPTTVAPDHGLPQGSEDQGPTPDPEVETGSPPSAGG